MTAGRARWETKDLRRFFPLPGERQRTPRFDGTYRAEGDDEAIRFRADGTLDWDGQAGSWRMHGTLLHIAGGAREGEGAIGPDCVYLLSWEGTDKGGRRQSVLRFANR